MIRVLHVISSAGMYGSENSTLQSMRHTPHTKESLVVFSPSDSIAPLADKARQLGYNTLVLSNNNIRMFTSIRYFWRFAREQKPDILHSHGYKELFFCAVFSVFLGCRLIHTNHGFVDNQRVKKNIYHFLEKSLCRILVAMPIIVLAKKTGNRFVSFGIPLRRIHFIQNSIHPEDVPQYMDMPEDLTSLFQENKKILVYIGRLSIEKGPDLLLHALKRVLPSYDKVLVLIIGDGCLKEDLVRLTSKLGLTDHVRFLGFRKDAKAIMANSFGVIIPSRTEAIPRTLMEGMLLEKTIVAAAVGDIPDVIEHGRHGILVPPENIELLTRGICRALENPVEAKEMGVKAHERIIKRFNASGRCAELARLYKQVTR